VTRAILVAVIAATLGVLAAVVGYLNARSLRRQTEGHASGPQFSIPARPA